VPRQRAQQRRAVAAPGSRHRSARCSVSAVSVLLARSALASTSAAGVCVS
jgi:hypothetical protein